MYTPPEAAQPIWMSLDAPTITAGGMVGLIQHKGD
jgi:hypothetical protein